MKALLLSFLCLTVLIKRISTKPTQTILDTDIGTDYDDQIPLTYILANPSIFDLKLVVCSTFNTTARAQIAAKTLAIFGRFDIPIGVGQDTGKRDMDEYEYGPKIILLINFERMEE